MDRTRRFWTLAGAPKHQPADAEAVAPGKGDSSIDSNAARSVTVRRPPSTSAQAREPPLQLPCWLLLINGSSLT